MTPKSKVRFTVDGFGLTQREVTQPKHRTPTTTVPKGWRRVVIIDVTEEDNAHPANPGRSPIGDRPQAAPTSPPSRRRGKSEGISRRADGALRGAVE
jgi:hypothetical protein